MTKTRGGLGRGLASLIPSGPDSPISTVLISPVVSRETPLRTVARSPTPISGGEPPSHVAIDVSRETAIHPRRHLPASPWRGQPAPSVDPDQPHYREIPVTAIQPNPHNPRTVFDEDALAELEHSIRAFGLLQPVVVRQRAPGSSW